MTSRIILERYFRFAVPFGIVFVVLYLTDFLELYSYHILAGELLESDVLKTVFWPVNAAGFCKSLILSPIDADFWVLPFG